MSHSSEKYGLVLCEGTDDCAVFKKIAEAADLQSFQFESFGGKDKLPERLKQLSLSPDFTRGRVRKILITRDADDSWEAAFRSLKDAVERAFGITLPKTGDWVTINDHCEIAVWVVPGDEQSGMLETLCLQAAKKSSSANFECLDQFAECLLKHTGAELHEKEKFAIWSLVAQEKERPRQRLSIQRAISKIPLDWKNPIFSELTQLINEASIQTTKKGRIDSQSTSGPG